MTSAKNTVSASYARAGVDVQAGYDAVRLMREHVARTLIPGVLGGLGGFGGMFELPEGLKHPVLVSGTDGVGTKLKIAFALDKHDTVGIDCVAMCVNDVLCCGARPLFFLDYVAVGKNYPERVAEIVAGVAEGCVQAGCALIGGETAEMPGFYPEDEYDIAGFCVGVVEKDEILNPKNGGINTHNINGGANSNINDSAYSHTANTHDEHNGSAYSLNNAGSNAHHQHEALNPTHGVNPHQHEALNSTHGVNAHQHEALNPTHGVNPHQHEALNPTHNATNKTIKPGDVVIALPSSGVHSNGFSLVRKILAAHDLHAYIPEFAHTLGEELLTPTKIYVRDVLPVVSRVKALAHITGGGFYENIPRAIPEGLCAKIQLSRIKTPPVFDLLMRAGNIELDEMYHVFNMGVGMIVIAESDGLVRDIPNAYVIGEIVKDEGGIILC